MDEMPSPMVKMWSSEPFHEEAGAWVREVCAGLDIELTGDSEQPHNRPWSSTIRFGSADGPLWFKVNGAGTRHEPLLVDVLAGLVPDLMAEVLATDAERGWSLTCDAGPVLRTTAGPDELWWQWEGILQRYADAQVLLADHVAELLATGVPEVSPETMPGQAALLLDELAQVAPGDGGLTPDEAERVGAILPEYDGWCAELAGSRIPSSVQHDDLHDGNICWMGTVGSSRIIDWGDASVGHPLGTMLCTLNSIVHRAQLDLDDTRVQRARDAYLEPFTVRADRSDLLRYVQLARRTGCVSRALSYRAALAGEPVATHAELDFPVRGWFLALLDD